MARNGFIAALDIGSSKIVCLIIQLDGARRPKNMPKGMEALAHVETVGIANHPSCGIKAGAIVDMVAAEDAILSTICDAERMVGEPVDRAIINLSAGAPVSRMVEVEIDLPHATVDKTELRSLDMHADASVAIEEYELIHAIPIRYTIDGQSGIHDPNGMYGKKLSATTHYMLAGRSALRNVASCVERCRLELSGRVLSPLASGVAVLNKDESELGSICIDIGGGVTSIGVWQDGRIIHGGILKIGADHITRDIAKCLGASLADAERLKILRGSALESSADETDLFSFLPVGEEDIRNKNELPLGRLTNIIKMRAEEMVGYIDEYLRDIGLDSSFSANLVLTGGGAQLNGISELTARILERQCRIGKPVGLPEMPEEMRGPAFAGVVGLIAYSLGAGNDRLVDSVDFRSFSNQGKLAGLRDWMRAYLF